MKITCSSCVSRKSQHLRSWITRTTDTLLFRTECFSVTLEFKSRFLDLIPGSWNRLTRSRDLITCIPGSRNHNTFFSRNEDPGTTKRIETSWFRTGCPILTDLWSYVSEQLCSCLWNSVVKGIEWSGEKGSSGRVPTAAKALRSRFCLLRPLRLTSYVD